MRANCLPIRSSYPYPATTYLASLQHGITPASTLGPLRLGNVRLPIQAISTAQICMHICKESNRRHFRERPEKTTKYRDSSLVLKAVWDPYMWYTRLMMNEQDFRNRWANKTWAHRIEVWIASYRYCGKQESWWGLKFGFGYTTCSVCFVLPWSSFSRLFPVCLFIHSFRYACGIREINIILLSACSPEV